MPNTPGLRDLLLEHVELALTLRRVRIYFDPERCLGLLECYEVCPVNCWRPDEERGRVVFQNEENCIACKACVLQCTAGAIELKVPDARKD